MISPDLVKQKYFFDRTINYKGLCFIVAVKFDKLNRLKRTLKNKCVIF